VNGVSALHTELMRRTVFRDFHHLFPDRIVNKTNGITFRRWLSEANPTLTGLITEAIGPAVLDAEGQLAEIGPWADDAAFRERFAAQRRANKVALAQLIDAQVGVRVDPDARFDVQIKRIHEYKRQLLNLLETIAQYQAIIAAPQREWAPQVRVLAGKAAAGYHTAKLIVKLATDVARVVNTDPLVGDRLKVVFLPNYNVSLAEAIVPAADVSEQISTAGMEASGTGNMKLALNGALTIGTLDGANVEILEHVGEEHLFIFGLTAEEAGARRAAGGGAAEAIAASPTLTAVLAALESGTFSPDDPARYRSLVAQLRAHDHYLVCADFEAYRAAQRRVDETWRTPEAWWRHAVRTTAGMGWFSSDRTIREYAGEIWDIPPRR